MELFFRSHILPLLFHVAALFSLSVGLATITQFASDLERDDETRLQLAGSFHLPRGEAKTSEIAKRAEKVEIFVTSWCPYCRELEALLVEQGVKYERFDIEKSSVGKRKHLELGGGGVPVIKIGSQVIRGFQRHELLQLLGKN